MMPQARVWASLLGRGGVECGFEVELAGFGDLESAGEVGAAWGFDKDNVGAGREFEGGGGVAVEFAVDENFGGVRFGGDSELTVTVG